MNKPEVIEKKVKNLLDESLYDLSPEISRRLQQARYQALEKVKPRSNWLFYPQAISAVLAVVIISVALLFSFDEGRLNQTELALATDIEVLTANESLDLMEDLEFTQWLLESEAYAS